MSEGMDIYKEAFLTEAKTHIDTMDTSLVGLEKVPHDTKLLHAIFSATHTLKSMAGTMGYVQLASLCHTMEDTLDEVRKEKLRLEPCINVLFECVDQLRSSVTALSTNEGELVTETQIERLRSTRGCSDMRGEGEVPHKEPLSAELERLERIEVKIDRLDKLMNLMEEFLVSRIRLDQLRATLGSPELAVAVETLGRLIADLQYHVMQVRLVPIGVVFNRFPRMVRDLAKREEKEIELMMEGRDIELDRTVIETVGDALVHLIRNAVDHGIEKTEERNKLGKKPQGTVYLKAESARDYAVIRVQDDGAGLDLEAIEHAARERGLITNSASREGVIQAIFSGLSTEKNVSDVSGRGLGLSIVREKIQAIGGHIEVESEKDIGTSFIIKIPLTLAVIRTLFVEVSGNVYAVPTANVERLLAVDHAFIKGFLERESILLSERSVPLVRLDELFGLECARLKRQPVVVLRQGEEYLGLAVHRMLSTQEVVVKPISQFVRKGRFFSGASLVGSGEVILILDIPQFFLLGKEAGEERVYAGSK